MMWHLEFIQKPLLFVHIGSDEQSQKLRFRLSES